MEYYNIMIFVVFQVSAPEMTFPFTVPATAFRCRSAMSISSSPLVLNARRSVWCQSACKVAMRQREWGSNMISQYISWFKILRCDLMSGARCALLVFLLWTYPGRYSHILPLLPPTCLQSLAFIALYTLSGVLRQCLFGQWVKKFYRVFCKTTEQGALPNAIGLQFR